MTPDVHWLIEHRGRVPRHNDWLGPNESATLGALRVVKRRADWRLGRWTAKCLLRARLGARTGPRFFRDVEIRAAADGAPLAFIHGDPAPVTISISHSRAVAFCALADGDVALGCDTERIERRSDVFVSDFFSRDERDRVARASPALRPLMTTLIWSAKESVLKARREGLRRDTRSIVVDVDDIEGRCDGADRGQWRRFTARCSDDGARYFGWWRLSQDFVYTVARGRA